MKFKHFALALAVVCIAGIVYTGLTLREHRAFRQFQYDTKKAFEMGVDSATEYLTGCVSSDCILDAATGEYLRSVFVESYAASTGLCSVPHYREEIEDCIRAFVVTDGADGMMIGKGGDCGWEIYTQAGDSETQAMHINEYLQNGSNKNPAGKPAGIWLVPESGTVTGKHASKRAVFVYLKEDSFNGINGTYDNSYVGNAQLLGKLCVDHPRLTEVEEGDGSGT